MASAVVRVGPGAGGPGAGSAADPAPSIAVLPFATRSDDRQDAYFSAGMHDDLLTQLAKIDGLKHSSETYQPPIYDRSLIDKTIEVPESMAYETTRRIASQEGIIAGLKLQHADLNIRTTGFYDFGLTLVTLSEELGFTYVTEPCITFFVIEDAYCDKPKEYLFWDLLHPTKAAHALLGRHALGQLPPLD